MLKYLIVVLNLVGVFSFTLLFPGGVKIEHRVPEKADPGTEFMVEITISKGDLNGFAKYMIELPEGFTATVVESHDATFSFKDQKVKFIWIALPAENEFTISYKVTTDPSVVGVFPLGGTFSYIFDNEKQAADVPVKEITIGDPSLIAVEEEAEEPVKGMVIEDPNEIRCSRTTSPIPGETRKFKVELRINKNDLTGYAKIEESLPEGFIASELDSRDGLFSFENQMVKIMWMALPEDKEYIVSYQITASEEVSGNHKVQGVFSFMRENDSHKYFLPESNIFIEKEEDEEVPTIIIADEGGDFKEKEQPEEIVEEVVEEVEEVVPDPPAPAVVDVPAPDTDILYRVQVAAGHRRISDDYFAKKYDLKDNIILENHEGWIKYTIGSFKVYKEGRNHRNKVWESNKITDAFVTAYNAGERITVQEALMISNQKWYN